MLFYYRLSGVNAIVAMMLNLVILLGAIAYFGVTMTLPGIAAVTLTIGVGIDSNVLIFERIREEIREGKTMHLAVAASFNRVFITLVDTHLAALISAAFLFLFLFGTGPIKGFAVTLVIGLSQICLQRCLCRERCSICWNENELTAAASFSLRDHWDF
jgi:preprotein translocase subunit SecD